MKRKVVIIGSGFSSLSAACYLAKMGHKVDVFEKNQDFGGRARQFKENGFTFDMGPSWYWMPDVFEKFFKDFDKNPEDFYLLKKLNPAYHVYFGKNDFIAIPDSLDKICEVFENEEPGSSKQLKKFHYSFWQSVLSVVMIMMEQFYHNLKLVSRIQLILTQEQ